MAGIFVYADDVMVSGELIALAKQLGQEACAIALSEADAQEHIKYGADKVFILKGNNPWPESYARPMAKLLEEQDATAFFIGATVRGRDIAARTAAYLKSGLVSDASQISFEGGKIQTERMMYGGAAVMAEAFQGLNVVTIPAGKYEATKDEARTMAIVTVAVEADQRVKLIGKAPTVKEGVNLTKASKIVCVGMGFDKKEDLKIAQDLAVVMDAEMACTRGMSEDRGWLPTEQYVGISGVMVKPELYLSLGVSGQIQHTFGIRDSKVIVGIDNNEKALMFKSADYGIVGDLYEIAPLLTEAIKNSK